MKTKLRWMLHVMIVLCMPLVMSAQSSDNIIINGDFSSGSLNPWSTFIADFAGASADVTVSDNRANVAVNAVDGTASWHVQLNQEFSSDQINALVVGSYYRIRFDVNAEAERPLTVYFGENGGNFTALRAVQITLPAGESTFEFPVLVSQTFGAMKLGFEFGLSTVDASITNVSLVEYEPNILTNSDFSTGDLTSWETYVADWAGATADFTVEDGVVSVDNITVDASASWHVQLNQIFSEEQIEALEIGGSYVLTFEANSTAERTVNVFFGENGGNFVALGLKTLTIPAGESEHQMVVPVSQKFGAMKLGFEFGLSAVSMSLSEIQMVRDDTVVEVIDDGDDEVVPSENVMDEDFILFAAGGRHISIPTFLHGSVIEVESVSDLPVIRFDYGNWNIGGFDWGSGGVSVKERREAQDSIFIRIWSSPNNLSTARETNGNNTAKIMFLDMPPPGNLEFRVQLALPDEVHVGEWMDIAIPLPAYATKTELEEAKTNNELTGYAALWDYWGSYSPARAEVISDVNDPDWREFSWERVRRFGIYWDQNHSPNAPIYIESIYIGRSGADLSVATEGPAPMAGISAVNDGDVNRISWSAREDVFSYGIYYSSEPITNLDSPKVRLWATVPGDSIQVEHDVYRAHTSVESHTYHYAVAPGNAWGVLSEDVSASSASVDSRGKDNGFMFQLTEDEENGVFNALDQGEFPGVNSFPVDTFQPIKLRYSDEVDDFWFGDDDSSGDVWLAYGTSGGFTTLFFYGEIYDDDVLAGPPSNPTEMSGTTIYPRNDSYDPTWVPGVREFDNELEWNYYLKDQVEVLFGAYTTDDYIIGSPNKFRSRGETPEYSLSFQPHFVNNGSVDFVNNDPDGLLVRLWVTEPSGDPVLDYNSLYYSSQHPLTTPAVYENIYDESDNRIGWRFFAAIDSQDLLVVTEGGVPVDTEMVLPESNELMYMPMTMMLWDKDGGLAPGNWWETATSVIQFPSKPWGQSGTVNSSDISGLGTIGVVGRELATSINESNSELPNQLALFQNYPNPFNPTTKIEFQLPQAMTVSVDIYNSIGQRVTRLVNAGLYQSGRHTVSFDASGLSSGIYFYRLTTDNQVMQRKMILIK
ncbi:MAG TPA: hypothetical protein DCE78_09235 [Bacteroidetes bacterium]|nr:hypothetical protein [Bacteroidota bacterium]